MKTAVATCLSCDSIATDGGFCALCRLEYEVEWTGKFEDECKSARQRAQYVAKAKPARRCVCGGPRDEDTCLSCGKLK
jgi:hypothetical protein